MRCLRLRTSVKNRKRCTKWFGTKVAKALGSELDVQPYIIRHIVQHRAYLEVCAGCLLLDDNVNLARISQIDCENRSGAKVAWAHKLEDVDPCCRLPGILRDVSHTLTVLSLSC